jgi:hypothetical protein
MEYESKWIINLLYIQFLCTKTRKQKDLRLRRLFKKDVHELQTTPSTSMVPYQGPGSRVPYCYLYRDICLLKK